jgi:hypothetical protein
MGYVRKVVRLIVAGVAGAAVLSFLSACRTIGRR